MCRWLAYSGDPVSLDELLFKPVHSLIDQSLHARLGAVTTNGDGFGIGWYADDRSPTLYRSVEPAWNDRNLIDLAPRLSSNIVFAHIRASTGSSIQQTNCHPFRHGRWLWMHNGQIAEFGKLKHELAFAVDASLYPHIEGSTDSELFFFLALTFGLDNDPPGAVERAAGFIEETGRKHGIAQPLRMTVATSDGIRIWAFRYSSDRQPGSLFYSTAVAELRERFPDNPIFQNLSDDARLVVSEPLSELEGVWQEFPASSCGIIQPGRDELLPFAPRSG